MLRGVDITGDRFGRLTAVQEGEMVRTNRHWVFRCDCGVIKSYRKAAVVNGKTRSCGCLRDQLAADARRTHGGCGTPEYRSWQMARDRCNNPKNKRYERYMARGIKMCERWNSFENFLQDMGKRPSARHSLDRIDNDGNYEPGNCRWATAKQQNSNRAGCGLTDEERKRRKRARDAAYGAIRRGKLIRPDRCECCNELTVVEAHHYKGYAWEHRFDVEWLCKPCHGSCWNS